jgi:hypothetical protein
MAANLELADEVLKVAGETPAQRAMPHRSAAASEIEQK